MLNKKKNARKILKYSDKVFIRCCCVVGETADICAADISKTQQLTSKQYRWINSTAGVRVNCPFEVKNETLTCFWGAGK